MVHKARCEADKLVEGLEHLTRLNPELMLCVTSLKKKATIDAVAKLDLARLHFVTFTTHLIGSMGGSNRTDKTLVGVAPAFRGVKHLGLQARGFLPDCFTPAGLARFADHLEGLEYFELDHHPRAAAAAREVRRRGADTPRVQVAEGGGHLRCQRSCVAGAPEHGDRHRRRLVAAHAEDRAAAGGAQVPLSALAKNFEFFASSSM